MAADKTKPTSYRSLKYSVSVSLRLSVSVRGMGCTGNLLECVSQAPATDVQGRGAGVFMKHPAPWQKATLSTEGRPGD